MGNRATSALGALLLLTGALAGCSGDAASPNPTSGVSAAAALAAVKAKVNAASSVHLTLAGKGLPDRVSGVVSADGVGTHAPVFKGTLQVKVNGTQAATDVVSVGGKVYVKLPFTSISTAVDPATLGAPNPAQLFAVDNGITSLLTSTRNPVAGQRTRKGSEVLTPTPARSAGPRSPTSSSSVTGPRRSGRPTASPTLVASCAPSS